MSQFRVCKVYLILDRAGRFFSPSSANICSSVFFVFSVFFLFLYIRFTPVVSFSVVLTFCNKFHQLIFRSSLFVNLRENPGWYCEIYWHSLCIDLLCAKTNHMQQWSNRRRTLKFRCQDRFGTLLRSNIRLKPQIKENQYCNVDDFAPE